MYLEFDSPISRPLLFRLVSTREEEKLCENLLAVRVSGILYQTAVVLDIKGELILSFGIY